MAYLEKSRAKLIQYKIEGQSKPFIDKNLQMQLPGLDSPKEKLDFQWPIYSHYRGAHPASTNLISQINVDELFQAMKEAERAHQAWENMQQNLKKAVNLPSQT